MTGYEVAQNALDNWHKYGYVYGFKGQIATESNVEAMISMYADTHFSGTGRQIAARKNVLRECVDCSGFVSICTGKGVMSARTFFERAVEVHSYSTTSMEAAPLGAAVYKSGHIGLYIGNGRIVEARDEVQGVAVTRVSDRDFTHWFLIDGIDYSASYQSLLTVQPEYNTYLGNETFGKLVNNVMWHESCTSAESPYAVCMEVLQCAFDNVRYKMVVNQNCTLEQAVELVRVQIFKSIPLLSREEGIVYWGYDIDDPDRGFLLADHAIEDFFMYGIRAFPGVSVAHYCTDNDFYNHDGTVAHPEDYINYSGFLADCGYMNTAFDTQGCRFCMLSENYPHFYWLAGTDDVDSTYINWLGRVDSTYVNYFHSLHDDDPIGILKFGDVILINGEVLDCYRFVDVDGFDAFVDKNAVTEALGVTIRFRKKFYKPTSSTPFVTAPGGTVQVSSYLPQLDSGSVSEVLGMDAASDGSTWFKVRALGIYTGYVAASAGVIFDEPDTDSWEGIAVAPTQHVNVRSGAGTTYPTITGCPMVNVGTTVTVIATIRGADDHDWYYVELPGPYYGYMRSDFVIYDGVEYEAAWTGHVSSVNGYVNVRTGPGTGYAQHSQVPTLNNGAEVTVIGKQTGADNHVWYQVKINSTYGGFIRSDLVIRQVTEGQALYSAVVNSVNGYVNVRSGPSTSYTTVAAVTPLYNGTSVEVLENVSGVDGYTWNSVRVFGNYYGYIRGDLLVQSVTNNYAQWLGYAHSVNGYVNVRSGPGTGYAVASGRSQLQNGEQVMVTGVTAGADGYLWYQVRIMSVYDGFIRSDLISAVQNVTPFEEFTPFAVSIYSVNGYVNVRTGPGTNYPQATAHPTLTNGTVITVINATDGLDGHVWYSIQMSDSTTGFVRSDLVQEVNNSIYTPWSGVVYSVYGVVNVRSGPGVTYDTIDGCPQLYNGEWVTVTGVVNGVDGYMWYSVGISGSYSGYIRCDLVVQPA